MTATSRNYRLTAILDTRDYDEPVGTLQEHLSSILQELGADISLAEEKGRFDFARQTEKNHAGDHYLYYEFSAGAELPAQLHERTRLDTNIKRLLVEERRA